MHRGICEWFYAYPAGTLRPAPSMHDVPKLYPLVVHHVHTEPLLGLIFTQSLYSLCVNKGTSRSGQDQVRQMKIQLPHLTHFQAQV